MNKTKNHIICETTQRASGVVQCQVVEAGKVVRSYKPQKNLILNQGLDLVCGTGVWCDLFTYCVAGTGTTATNFASGAGQNGSGAATTFTGPGSFDFTVSAAIGDMIKMTSGASSGSEVRITAIGGATSVTYTPSGTLSSGEFTVYKTSQVGLATETKRTNTYLTGSGNCGSSVSGSNVILKRTFDFSAEVGSVTFNEVGLSYTNSSGSNLFSRIKLSSGIPLTAGQQLRVIYTLTIALSPTTLTAATFTITGWPVLPSTSLDGDQQWQLCGITGIDTNGGNSVTDATGGGIGLGCGCMEPSYTTASGGFFCHIWISPDATAPTTFNTTPVNRLTNYEHKAVTLSSYTNLDFYRDKTTTFLVGEANRADWRSMGMGIHNTAGISITSANNGCAFVCVFDEVQTKNSLYTLTLTFRITVGRTLA